jgi:ATP-dependent Lon protease
MRPGVSPGGHNSLSDIETRLRNILSHYKSLKTKILELDIPDDQKAVIYDKYLQFEKLDPDSTTAANIKEWIEHTIRIPFGKTQDIFRQDNKAEILYKLKTGLDENLYGMEEVKEQILCIFNNKLKNPETKGMSIGMVGSQEWEKQQSLKPLPKPLIPNFNKFH